MGRYFVDSPTETQEQQYFANSKKLRYPRKERIKFRIGQVVQHRHFGYRGVIIGWDECARAPVEWLKHNHASPELQHLPSYSVVRDDRDEGGMMYVVESNLALYAGEVVSAALDSYVDVFMHKHNRYLLRKDIRRCYPDDYEDVD